MGHWQERWNESVELWKIIENNTEVHPLRCHTICELAKTCSSIEGDAAELGVYLGGTARLISEVLKNKTTHLFDTFTGLPPTTELDQMQEGDLSANEEIVRKFLKHQNVEFHVGLFPDTTVGLEDKKFCFVHSDCDLHQSTMDACSFFYPRLSPSGIMVFDDYGFTETKGCTLAVDEFFEDKEEYPVYVARHCFVIKQG